MRKKEERKKISETSPQTGDSILLLSGVFAREGVGGWKEEEAVESGSGNEQESAAAAVPSAKPTQTVGLVEATPSSTRSLLAFIAPHSQLLSKHCFQPPTPNPQTTLKLGL